MTLSITHVDLLYEVPPRVFVCPYFLPQYDCYLLKNILCEKV